MSYEDSKKDTQRYQKVKKIVDDFYGYDNFKPHQYEIINRVINKQDVCAIMPTGYGKSMCFQIPALYMAKTCIVVSPLIALMEDQHRRLESIGVSSICFNSNTTDKSIQKKKIIAGEYSIVFMTPEMITKGDGLLTSVYEGDGISLFAIDEAHCISSYGCDFRESYRGLSCLKEWFPDVPILSLTATATEKVGDDICEVLGTPDAIRIKTSFDRPNLKIHVSAKKQKFSEVLDVMRKHNGHTIIIYCLTRGETEQIALAINDIGMSAGAYHAGLKNTIRTETQNNFMDGKIKCIVATNAFGMGIDKKDVRVVINYGCPKNIEAYYQEIGRAGRDGKKSNCYLFYSVRDFKINRMFIDTMENKKFQNNMLSLLNIMERYVNLTTCRRKYVLEYFGESCKKSNCENCDICKENSDDTLKTKNISYPALLLLKCLKETRAVYGYGTTIGILRGSNNKKIPVKFQSCKIFGKGSYLSEEKWKFLIRHLIKENYIEESAVNKPGIPFFSRLIATKKGVKWFDDNDNVLIMVNYEQIDTNTIQFLTSSINIKMTPEFNALK